MFTNVCFIIYIYICLSLCYRIQCHSVVRQKVQRKEKNLFLSTSRLIIKTSPISGQALCLSHAVNSVGQATSIIKETLKQTSVNKREHVTENVGVWQQIIISHFDHLNNQFKSFWTLLYESLINYPFEYCKVFVFLTVGQDADFSLLCEKKKRLAYPAQQEMLSLTLKCGQSFVLCQKALKCQVGVKFFNGSFMFKNYHSLKLYFLWQGVYYLSRTVGVVPHKK